MSEHVPSQESFAIPDLFRRYVDRNVGSGPTPRRVRFAQIGKMQLKPGRWLSFAAKQEMAIHRVEFAWDARFRLATLVSVHVRDWYRDGDGGLDGRLFGRMPIIHAGGAEVARGEAMRYLAELPWAPHAMLANHALEWREIDGRSVEVSTLVGKTRVAVMLQLDSQGDITEASADARPRLVGKKAVPTAFRGIYSEYRVIGGVRMPTRAEAAWLLSEGPYPYFRGRLTDFVVD